MNEANKKRMAMLQNVVEVVERCGGIDSVKKLLDAASLLSRVNWKTLTPTKPEIPEEDCEED